MLLAFGTVVNKGIFRGWGMSTLLVFVLISAIVFAVLLFLFKLKKPDDNGKGKLETSKKSISIPATTILKRDTNAEVSPSINKKENGSNN